MNALMNAVKTFAHDDDGITAIEYGLIAAVMATAVATAFGLLGPALRDAFTGIAAKINPTP